MDCNTLSSEGRFRYRAAAIIIEDKKVLMATNELVDYYYSIGGAVLLHETAEEAVLREVFEETGINYEIDRLAFIHENFYQELVLNKNMRFHEISFYFLMKSQDEKLEINISEVFPGVKEQIVWLPLDSLNKLKIFPTFFRDKLPIIDNKVEHIISEEYQRKN